MKKLSFVFVLLFTLLIPQSLTLAAPTPSQLIIINTATNKLAFYENGSLVAEFPVATGKSSTQTPRGMFSIATKIKNRPYYTGGIPGGDPRNPLGDRWMGLSIPGGAYAIHGNNNESSIGHSVSHGCVRMHNADIHWLFDRINIGATVIIKDTQASYQDIAASYGISIGYAPAKGVLDNPTPGASLSGDYNLSGWFLDGSGVSRMEVLVDGAVIGQAAYGDARPDVKQAYPEYNNGNAGYHYTLNTAGLRNGSHRITVRETGASGQVTTLPEVSVTVSNAMGVLDNPTSGALLNGSYNLSGWFLDASGVSKVEVLVDGAVKGQAAYGDARPDVRQAYPEYNNGNAGYHYTLDTTELSTGGHRITVRETGKNGKVTTLPEIPVTVSNVRGVLDIPTSGASISGSSNLSGWFLDASGVSKVEILVDGAVKGQAAYGDARPDVKQAYPEYNNGNAGYHYTLDTTSLSTGGHRIAVRETGKNGKVTTLPEVPITVSNVRGVLDTPASGASISGSSNLSGWFLDASGVSKVEVLVDGSVKGQATYGDARPDVRQAYPSYNNGNAGYHYTLDTTDLSNGSHRITIRETGKNGYVTTLPEVSVTVWNAKGFLDSPAAGAVLKGNENISGWFLDKNGVSKVEVLVDGVVAGQAVYGDARKDVQNVYPEYNNGNSGYHYTLNTLKFSNGSHRITVKETGKNGKVTVLPEKTITISNAK